MTTHRPIQNGSPQRCFWNSLSRPPGWRSFHPKSGHCISGCFLGESFCPMSRGEDEGWYWVAMKQHAWGAGYSHVTYQVQVHMCNRLSSICLWILTITATLPSGFQATIADKMITCLFLILGIWQCNECCNDYSFSTPTELIKSCNDYSFFLWIPWLRIRLVVVG